MYCPRNCIFDASIGVPQKRHAFFGDVNCCLQYELCVGRGHDPADPFGRKSGKITSKTLRLQRISYSVFTETPRRGHDPALRMACVIIR